ncbi:phosphatidylserine lipase ABHD16A-like isoform X2 [Dysidea avara]|uniref:phosphatidylserine lipase ABHD16A-like isoform X2 n=1 Tax=Dysidea avara TaxID=196820 RepID=UPI00332CD8BC
MTFLRMIWLCFFGPRVRRNFFEGPGLEGKPYTPNVVEKYSDRVITLGRSFLSFLYHTSPFFIFYYAVKEGLGRMANKDYRQFLICLIKSRSIRGAFKHQDALQTGINRYDFEMSHHPISFKQSDASIKPRVMYEAMQLSMLDRLLRLPIYAFSYFAAHMFGRRLMYPGSLALIQTAMGPYLEQGRTKHVRQRNGIRIKLLAADGNCIDAMFLDRRMTSHKNDYGNKLVICCEGNASFYEVGMMEIPIDGGFSVLGWNHPGFAESTGLPFPSQESNAIDVVLKYAVCELGFPFEDIVVYGWSIGGYTASWAAMSYPKISAVIMDATFDHVLPLAQSRMPASMANVVDTVVRDCMDLNIAEQLCYYPGPVYLIRRGQDEMITTTPLDRKTNRINPLLIQLLQTRYPHLVTPHSLEILQNWINSDSAATKGIEISIGVNGSHCHAMLSDYMATNGSEFPWKIGIDLGQEDKVKLLLYVASQYFTTHELKHNDPLPVERFKIPLAGNLQFLEVV